MKFVIDRFEKDIAIVELLNGEIVDCPRTLLPGGCKEGDVLNISVDNKATIEKKAMLTGKMNKLFKE